MTMTQILLERIPADIKQKVCRDWLIYCVCGGVCGVDIISLILKHTTWDEEVMNVIVGLLIETLEFRSKMPIFVAVLEKVPDSELGTFLKTNFDIENFPFPNPSDWLFDTAKQSSLYLMQREAMVLKNILRVVFPAHSCAQFPSMPNHHLTQ